MTVRLDKEGAVGVIVLDRPPANSYDYGFLEELGAAVDEARFDDEGRALIASGRTLTPGEAGGPGLVGQLFEDAAACRAAAVQYCAKLAEGPSEAIGRAKVAASLGYAAPLDLGLAIEREAIARVFAT